jgi:uncharacterized membrane protein
MFGFLFGFLCLVGLIVVLKRGRRGYRGCGRGWHHRRRGRRGRWADDADTSDAGFEGSGGPTFFLRWLFERLDTTPGQEKEIRAAVEELTAKRRELKREGRASRDDLAKLLRTETLDEEVLGAMYARHDERLRDLQKAFGDTLGRVHQALDPQQREELARLLERGRGFGPYREWA